MPRKYHHNVYVIELDPAIFNIARFRNANPDRDLLKPAVYVGMTGLTPEERFAKHKAGIRANRYVQRFGLRLLPRLYAYANPMPYQAARHGGRARHRAAGAGLRGLAGVKIGVRLSRRSTRRL